MSVQRDNAACLESLELFLENITQTPIIEGLLSIREQADEITQQNTSEEMIVEDVTKQLLREVKTWTQVLLDEEVRRINSKIPYLQKLLTALFVMKVKVLSCINMKKDNGDFPLTIPSNSTFIHQAYINCANVILDNPYVLSDMKIVDLRPLIAEGIRKACFACIEWSDLLEWGLDGVDVNDIIKAVTEENTNEGHSEDNNETSNEVDEDINKWPDDSNNDEEFHDLANDVKMNENEDENEDQNNDYTNKEDNGDEIENNNDRNSVSDDASIVSESVDSSTPQNDVEATKNVNSNNSTSFF